jgi:hypothetical protein
MGNADFCIFIPSIVDYHYGAGDICLLNKPEKPAQPDIFISLCNGFLLGIYGINAPGRR